MRSMSPAPRKDRDKDRESKDQKPDLKEDLKAIKIEKVGSKDLAVRKRVVICRLSR